MTLLALACLLATTPVQALGQAKVVAGNRVAARDRALDEALKQAVDQALAYVLDADTRLRAQAALRRELLPRARSYVPTYRVLDEHEVEGGLFQVQIEAQVEVSLLRRDAVAIAGTGGGPGPRPPTPPPIAPAPPGRPRVLVGFGGPVAADATRRALETRGFLVVAAPVGETARSDLEASSLLRGAGAGIVVVAAVSSQPEGRVRGTEMMATQVRVELRALDGEGRALARGAGEARGFAPSGTEATQQALENASGPAADKLADELSARYSAPSTGSGDGGGVVVRVAGLGSLRDVEALSDQLAQLPGVQAASVRRLGGGEVWLGVRTAQTGGTLAAALRAQGLQVDAASDREVRARLARTGP